MIYVPYNKKFAWTTIKTTIYPTKITFPFNWQSTPSISFIINYFIIFFFFGKYCNCNKSFLINKPLYVIFILSQFKSAAFPSIVVLHVIHQIRNARQTMIIDYTNASDFCHLHMPPNWQIFYS